MTLTGERLARAIRAYPGETYSACAWTIFWDYKCEIEGRGESILSEEHRWQTALQLFAYLCCFGMGRAKTRLTSITIDHFADVLSHIRPDTFAALLDVKFENIDDSDEDVLKAAWRQLREGLAKHNVSTTATMVTKILMGLWGEIPAFDRYFREVHRKVFGSWHEHTMPVLRELQDAYHESWKPALKGLEPPYTHTRRGQSNRIPVARLIDMGFWYLGYTNADI